MARFEAGVGRGRPVAVLAVVVACLLGIPGGASAERKAGSVDKEKGTFSPGREPVAAYGAEAGKCPTSGPIRVIEPELETAAKKAGHAAPKTSGTLCAIAETFLGWDPAAFGQLPRDTVLAATSQWFGLASPVGQILVATLDGVPEGSGEGGGTKTNETIAEKLVSPAGNFLINAPAPRWGLATQRVKRGTYKVALVLQNEPVVVTGLPRKLEAGRSAPFTATLAPGFTNGHVLISDPRGNFSEAKGTGQAVTAELKCGDRPGRAVVEIRGEEGGAETVLGSFPVGCGVDLPLEAPLAVETWAGTPDQQGEIMLQRINAERQAVGLAPLVPDGDLMSVAKKTSASYAGGGSGVDVAGLLQQAGIWTPVAVQSVAADRAVSSAWERLMRSPTNRANILNADVTNAGIGVTAVAEGAGQVFYIAALLIKEQPAVDVPKAREALRAAVLQKRKDARVGAITPDAELDALAQKYADQLGAAGGNLPKAEATALLAPAQAQWKLTALAGARAEMLDLAEEPEVTGHAKAFGVGMATGKHPKLGRHAVYAVILLGAPQAGGASAAAEKPAKAGKPAGAKPAPAPAKKPAK